jgi:hypothetical protein
MVKKIAIVCVRIFVLRTQFQHSYIDHLAPWEQRQRQLLLEYFFECRCQRCRDEYLTALENTLNCGKFK